MLPEPRGSRKRRITSATNIPLDILVSIPDMRDEPIRETEGLPTMRTSVRALRRIRKVTSAPSDRQSRISSLAIASGGAIGRPSSKRQSGAR